MTLMVFLLRRICSEALSSGLYTSVPSSHRSAITEIFSALLHLEYGVIRRLCFRPSEGAIDNGFAHAVTTVDAAFEFPGVGFPMIAQNCCRYLLHSPNMLRPIAYALLINGFADWEAASALAELQRTFDYCVKVIGLTSDTVVSMGGFKVIPDLTVSEFVADSAGILILPGGDAWAGGELPEVSHAVRAVVRLGRPVAAICAATLALAHAGLLNDRLHTSNGAGFIEKHVAEYRGQNMYRPLRSVRDSGVITANGLAPFAFAAEIFRALVPGREGD